MPDFDFGDLATSQDFGAYFQPQSIPSAPSFTPETTWTAPPGSVKDTGIMTDFAGAAKSALPWLQLGTTALGAVSGVQAAHDVASVDLEASAVDEGRGA